MKFPNLSTAVRAARDYGISPAYWSFTEDLLLVDRPVGVPFAAIVIGEGGGLSIRYFPPPRTFTATLPIGPSLN